MRRSIMLVAAMGTALVLACGVALAAVLTGTEGADTIKGTEGQDQITGLGGADRIAGDPTAAGPGAADTIDGGAGDDPILTGYRGDDTIIGGDGSDYLYGDTAGNGEGNDTLHGDAGPGQTASAPGVDEMIGFAGNDKEYGGPGNDFMGTYYTTSGAAQDSGDDEMYGEDGDDTISGGTGADTIEGGPGNDSLSDGEPGGETPSIDNLSGGVGSDTIYAANKPAAKDIVVCGSEQDTVEADLEDDVASDCETLAYRAGTPAAAVTGTEPAGGATGVARAVGSVSADFSMQMNPATITASTVKLQQYTKRKVRGKWRWVWVAVPAGVSYDEEARRAALDPYPADAARALAANARYMVTVTTGAKDRAGRALDQNPTASGNQPKVWTFTTGSS